MEIRINGKLLDIIPQEVSISWKSFVFADAIGDQYTNDIELPRTENNSAILQPFGVLDGLNHFQQRIRCAVSIDLIGCDGYMQISALKRDTITAALFLSPLPYDLIDRKIRDLIHDTNYIREWDAAAPTSYTGGHAAGLQRSLFVNAGGLKALPWSLRLSEFLTALSTATGVTLNFPFTEVFRVVAATPKVSPFNALQLVQANINGTPTAPLEDRINMIAGQHVCTDVDSPRNLRQNITIMRKCEAKFTGLAGNGSLYLTIGGIQSIYYMPSSLTFTLAPGDSFYYACPYNSNWFASVLKVEYSNYSTDDEDTDTLVFPGRINDPDGTPIAFYTLPEGVYTGGVEYRYDGTGGMPRYSFAYMDYWWCIGNMTIRELINALCRIKGQPLASVGSSVGFGTADAINIGGNGDITSIRPASQAVGAVTRLEYNDHSERMPQELMFSGDFLPDTLTVYKSIFYGATASDFGVAQVPFFAVEDAATLGYTWQDCGAVMLEEMSTVEGGVTIYALAPLPDMQWLGIDNLTDTIEAEIETYTDLRGYTYCYYEGRKYILIEADTDTDTGLCNATGLLVI